MTTRRARRTARSAGLVALAATAAFSLTACQNGGNDAAAGPEKKISSSASRSTGGDGAPSGAKAGADEVRTSVRSEASATHRTTARAATAKTATPVRTQTLADGSTAKIYELGAQHYRAKIVSRGSVVATLETNQADTGLDANDMFVVLTLSGQVHSWMGGGHPGRAPSSSPAVGRPRSRRSASCGTARRSSATRAGWMPRWRRTSTTPGSTPTACTSCSATAV